MVCGLVSYAVWDKASLVILYDVMLLSDAVLLLDLCATVWDETSSGTLSEASLVILEGVQSPQ